MQLTFGDAETLGQRKRTRREISEVEISVSPIEILGLPFFGPSGWSPMSICIIVGGSSAGTGSAAIAKQVPGIG